VNGFSLWIGFGAALGLWRVWRSAPERQAAIWLNLGLLSLFGALVGARLFYVWQNWEYFAAHGAEIARLSEGGLGWPGAAAGAALVILWFALFQTQPGELRRIRFAPGLICDRLYPLLPPLAVSAWLGCWQIGTAYGAALPEKTWWGMPTPDEAGIVSLRFPLQPLAALSLLLFFWFIETHGRVPRPAAGRLSTLGVTGLLLHLLAFSLLVAEPAPTWNGLRTDSWAAVILLAIFLVVISANSLRVRIHRRHSLSVR